MSQEHEQSLRSHGSWQDTLFPASFAAMTAINAIYAYTRFINPYTFGKIIEDHVGNVGPSSALIISSLFVKEGLREIGEKQDWGWATWLSKHTPAIAAALVINTNLFFETIPNNPEFTGDLAFGLLALALTLPATQWAINRFKNSSKELPNPQGKNHEPPSEHGNSEFVLPPRSAGNQTSQD